MKKIINDPNRFVDECLEGLLLAHRDALKSVTADNRALVRADAPVKGKVGIVTGGGSGHLPVFLGYVGKGLADGVAVGNVFSSPPASTMYAATNAVNGGAGVLYLYGNYAGDRLNFETAEEMAEAEDINVEQVLVADDVASAPAGRADQRRGIAGLFFAYKIAGACAEEMASLAEVKAAAELALANTRTMGVALSPCIVPAAGKPTFTIGEQEMEIGMGIHGEPGVQRGPLQTADQIVATLLERIVDDLPFRPGDEVAVLVNSLGATPPEELYIMFRAAHRFLDEAQIKIHRAYIGEYATSLEMAGASLSLMRLDSKLKRWLDAPAASPFFSQGADGTRR
jgi:phosphoenolpyruvate---glycerone phosphotransferase subunit DhaK